MGYGWGPGSFGTNVSNITTQAIYDRVQTPGATSSVTFNFTAFPGVLEQWTWRVNITNVNVGDLPNNGAYAENGARGFGQELEDPHFVNVAYDFQWPEGGEIQDALNRTFSESGAHTSTGPGQLCAAYFNMQGLPSDITNRYKESDNGDCTGVFGEDCVAAMLNASALWSGNGGVCGLPGRGFTELPQCQSIFNTTKYPGRFCGATGGQRKLKLQVMSTAELTCSDRAGQHNLERGDRVSPWRLSTSYQWREFHVSQLSPDERHQRDALPKGKSRATSYCIECSPGIEADAVSTSQQDRCTYLQCRDCWCLVCQRIERLRSRGSLLVTVEQDRAKVGTPHLGHRERAHAAWTFLYRCEQESSSRTCPHI